MSPLKTHIETHTYTHTNTLATNFTTGYTMYDVNTEDTTRDNIALMTSTSRVYIPYPLGTIIK